MSFPGWGYAAGAILEQGQRWQTGRRTAAIKLDSVNLIRALQPLADALGAEFLQAKSLPMLPGATRRRAPRC